MSEPLPILSTSETSTPKDSCQTKSVDDTDSSQSESDDETKQFSQNWVKRYVFSQFQDPLPIPKEGRDPCKYLQLYHQGALILYHKHK